MDNRIVFMKPPVQFVDNAANRAQWCPYAELGSASDLSMVHILSV